MNNKEQIIEEIRLNRFIAMCGICSRRKADHLIQDGQITIKDRYGNIGWAQSGKLNNKGYRNSE